MIVAWKQVQNPAYRPSAAFFCALFMAGFGWADIGLG